MCKKSQISTPLANKENNYLSCKTGNNSIFPIPPEASAFKCTHWDKTAENLDSIVLRGTQFLFSILFYKIV